MKLKELLFGRSAEDIARMCMQPKDEYTEMRKAVEKLDVSAIEGIDSINVVLARCINALIERIEKLE